MYKLESKVKLFRLEDNDPTHCPGCDQEINRDTILLDGTWFCKKFSGSNDEWFYDLCEKCQDSIFNPNFFLECNSRIRSAPEKYTYKIFRRNILRLELSEEKLDFISTEADYEWVENDRKWFTGNQNRNYRIRKQFIGEFIDCELENTEGNPYRRPVIVKQVDKDLHFTLLMRYEVDDRIISRLNESDSEIRTYLTEMGVDPEVVLVK
ncbi:hypothetical protein [Solemya velesiana gill symbiont]|uniref:Uncharacterized protein n=1 Tax=Solemya velesiana gill symbiont TaxID=1918948 RepID=A0A1T2KQ78_9GAMM|nr:hypothetical protein [Solemya velesiana gill symbiont]OOZ34941.1 hypothetical protein BOW51_11775 [Solemya velesiana gill symbiont]